MGPVFPTTVALVGDVFPRMTGTAIGVAITSGWIGLAVSSRVIGLIASGDPGRLRKALLVLPGMSLVMVAVKNIARRLGDDISEAKPILDSRLPDGSPDYSDPDFCPVLWRGQGADGSGHHALEVGHVSLSLGPAAPRNRPP